jgi:hypothetical protein
MAGWPDGIWRMHRMVKPLKNKAQSQIANAKNGKMTPNP